MYIFGGNHNGRYLSDLHVSITFYMLLLHLCNLSFQILGHFLTPTLTLLQRAFSSVPVSCGIDD